MNHRLPEVLWAALLAGNLPRARTLAIFRDVATYFHSLGERATGDIRLTRIAELPPVDRQGLLATIAADEPTRRVLAGMLWFDSLPGRDAWGEAIGTTISGDSEYLLQRGVGRCLFHQSEQATDCRWARVLSMISAGRLKFPPQLAHIAREILNFPNEGDMKAVRPSIRSAEGSMSAAEQEAGAGSWANAFWNECLRKSPCFPLLRRRLATPLAVGSTLQRIEEVEQRLIEHAQAVRRSSGIDARHDTTFGFALYALRIVRELFSVGNASSVLGRAGLRTLLECYVTLAYLRKKDKPDFWMSYRVFGAGQAKLSSLKLEDLDSESSFADPEVLKEIANEDMWEEFLPINVGHWENSTLRREAVEAGVKDQYDKYYAWTSSYLHGHWGSIRESVFETCGNPLHRLHRIPKRVLTPSPDVISNACELTDYILALLSELYPTFPYKLSTA
jgi:hypothetical protein